MLWYVFNYYQATNKPPNSLLVLLDSSNERRSRQRTLEGALARHWCHEHEKSHANQQKAIITFPSSWAFFSITPIFVSQAVITTVAKTNLASYNAVLFQTYSTNAYTALVAQESFAKDGNVTVKFSHNPLEAEPMHRTFGGLARHLHKKYT